MGGPSTYPDPVRSSRRLSRSHFSWLQENRYATPAIARFAVRTACDAVRGFLDQVVTAVENDVDAELT
jgi:hypothetical protein